MKLQLFVNGKELGNSFSELNDPKEQAKRFDLQVEEKNAGDEEAMHFDKDYIVSSPHFKHLRLIPK